MSDEDGRKLYNRFGPTLEPPTQAERRRQEEERREQQRHERQQKTSQKEQKRGQHRRQQHGSAFYDDYGDEANYHNLEGYDEVYDQVMANFLYTATHFAGTEA